MSCCCCVSSRERPTISDPKDFQHRVHTEYDAENRQYKGLPPQWRSLVSQSGPRPKPIVEGLALTDEETKRILAALPPIHPEQEPDTEVPHSVGQSPVLSNTSTGHADDVKRPYPATTHAEGSTSSPGSGTTSQTDGTSAASPEAGAVYETVANTGSGDVIQPVASSTLTKDHAKKPDAQPHGKQRNANGALSHAEFRAQLQMHVSAERNRGNFDNFVRVGEGSTGVVVTARDLVNKKVVAIKKMDLTKQQRRELLFNEVGASPLYEPCVHEGMWTGVCMCMCVAIACRSILRYGFAMDPLVGLH